MSSKFYITGFLFFLFYFLEIAFAIPTNASEDLHKPAHNNESHYKVPLRLTNSHSAIPELKSVDSVFTKFIRRWGVAGASVAIAKDGKLIYAKGFGLADRETKELVEPEHLFRIASVSKLITAIGIMKLVDRGVLDLDDKVFGSSGILNDSIYSKIADPRACKITVRHLLKHQGGWSANMGDPMFETLEIAQKMNVPPPASPTVVTQYVLSKRLHFHPGTRSSYSNVGYSILGQVIAKISGMPYEDYIQHAILKPIGIKDMQIGKNVLGEKAPNEVTYYDHDGAVPRLSIYGTGDYVSRTYDGTHVEGLGAAGGWLATSSDLIKIILSVDGFDTKEDLLTPEAIDLMTTEIEPGESPFGWKGVDSKGNWWRTGTLAGTSALIMRQADGLSFAVILNSSIYSGPRFTTEINKAMQNALSKVNEWPVKDLFNLYEPSVVLPIAPKGWPEFIN